MNNPKGLFMLCESIQEPSELAKLDRARWKANIKYDGERVMAVKEGSEVILFNRRGNTISFKFREVVEALKEINSDFIIDGEIISLDNNFNNLQRRALTKDIKKIAELEKSIPIKYMVFDILKFGKDILMKEPLRNRLSCLNSLIKNNNAIELCEYGEIDDMLSRAIKNNGEGIVIKDMNGLYEGKRSKLWFKHKLRLERFITFSIYGINNKGLRLSDEKDNAIQMSQMELKDEIINRIERDGYVKCEVECLGVFESGKMRQPTFKRLCEN